MITLDTSARDGSCTESHGLSSSIEWQKLQLELTPPQSPSMHACAEKSCAGNFELASTDDIEADTAGRGASRMGLQAAGDPPESAG
jgi:hypothetical protein